MAHQPVATTGPELGFIDRPIPQGWQTSRENLSRTEQRLPMFRASHPYLVCLHATAALGGGGIVATTAPYNWEGEGGEVRPTEFRVCPTDICLSAYCTYSTYAGGPRRVAVLSRIQACKAPDETASHHCTISPISGRFAGPLISC